VANEIHAGWVKALGENLERWGSASAVITNASPDRLLAVGAVFDRVIVDAPCTGEGLFRREPEARAEWSIARVLGSADRQRHILEAAIQLVRPGGMLVYSTCTFNQHENEQVIDALLAAHPPWRLDERIRLWPHKVRGEGHAISRLARSGMVHSRDIGRCGRADETTAGEAWGSVVEECFTSDPIAELPGSLTWRDDRLLLATGHGLDTAHIPVVRDGLWLGDRKPGRFEPAHALALAIDPELARNRLDLGVGQARRWIAGEPVAEEGPAGWVLVTVDGFGLGWGKRSGGVVKNRYPKGLRRG
jgi:NOL1/NOP2/fmu family ribosome biogenesis protein